MELVKISKFNFKEVINLALGEQQKNFVSSNLASMAESSVNPDYQPRALVIGGEVVGFAMYTEWVNALWMKEQRPNEYYIFRMMVDVNHQGNGYGRKLMSLLLDEIKAKKPKVIHIAYCDSNATARSLYQSLGFKEYGKFDWGDVAAKIELSL